MALLSRSLRRRFLRPRPLILLCIFICLLDAMFIINSLPPSYRVSPSSPNLPPQKIFIASMFRNSEYILRLSYINTLLALITYLGPSNVFVSISESGSLENTKGALMDLKEDLEKLGVRHRIITGIDHEQQQEMLRNLPAEGKRQGWVYTGRPESKSGKEGWELRRIPYLAKERNMVMEPLVANNEREWNKVLWINDIVFSTEDVVTLLETRGGSYDAACSLDFSASPTHYYDTFALRDSLGQKAASQSWPYFLSQDSLSALRSNQPVPVKSCWNGMIVMDATPFYPISSGGSGLRFRGVDDALAQLHVEGSECCLIHADNRKLGEDKGVWLNPNVRVSYNVTTYPIVNPGKIAETGQQWPTNWDMIKGIWENRITRWIGWVRLWSEGKVVKARVKKWMKEGTKKGKNEKRVELGVECLVNEMQVLYQNGWHHV